jgi:tyrosyl-tRNA synthetase
VNANKPTDSPAEPQTSALMSGCAYGDAELEKAMRERLRQRIEEATRQGRPLRVYAGYDPSAPDLHLGHSITLRKLRQFQQFGHDVTVVIGTVTATIGDTSDRASGRPRKSTDEVTGAAQTYAEQVFRILDPARTTIVANGDWLDPMTVPQLLDIASQFTVQQFLARDNYRRRIDRGEPVGLHEFFYALLQGYDAVHLHADVQLGGTEQLFNILAAAKLQEAFGQPPLVALTFPILVGLDGTQRMSKSRGNYLALAEAPADQYGKAMSISDDTMLQWAGLISDWTPAEVDEFRNAVTTGALHPMAAKKRLASHIVAMYHGADAAERARQQFEDLHQRGKQPEDIPIHPLPGGLDVVDALVRIGAAASRNAARRLIAGGGVQVDSKRVETPDLLLTPPATIKVGPRRFYRVTTE